MSVSTDERIELACSQFGVDYLFPYQRLVISNVLERRDQLVVLPTGAGKSLCFLLPAAMLAGVTVVVYPLRSLIADQFRRLSNGTIRAESLSGETPSGDREALFERCRVGQTRILLTNPEMLIQPKVRRALAACEIAHLVINEAHVLPTWGASFRPAYLDFARVAREIGPKIVSAFTATASRPIVEELNERLFPNAAPNHVRGNPDRPDIHYSVRPVFSIRHELNVLCQDADRPLLIFCRSRVGAELTARHIREDTGDRQVRFYHAGLDPKEKNRVETWFFSADDAVLATTCAYGMGVDKPDIRTVVHADVPDSIEAYLQETGRAGRDGMEASAIAIASSMRNETTAAAGVGGRIGEDETRDESHIAHSDAEDMIRYLSAFDECRRVYLLRFLETEIDSCTGCDVCDGNSTGRPLLHRGVSQFFRRNSHRYERSDLPRFLKRWLERAGDVWREREVEELIVSVEREGVAGPPASRIGKLFFGKGFVSGYWRTNRSRLTG